MKLDIVEKLLDSAPDRDGEPVCVGDKVWLWNRIQTVEEVLPDHRRLRFGDVVVSSSSVIYANGLNKR